MDRDVRLELIYEVLCELPNRSPLYEYQETHRLGLCPGPEWRLAHFVGRDTNNNGDRCIWERVTYGA